MTTAHNNADIPLGKKITPLPFLREGWLPVNDQQDVIWSTNQIASISITVPSPADHYYFMVEVTSHSTFPSQAKTVTIRANNEYVGQWLVDSPIIHDKLVIIPGNIVRDNNLYISFESDSGSAPKLNKFDEKELNRIQFHSIFIDITLNAYLEELQTGFDWVCEARDTLVATAKKVLYFSQFTKQSPIALRSKLREITNHDLVVNNYKENLVFNRNYFNENLAILREGVIHFEIREWHKTLQDLNDTIIDAGNYILRQPDFKLTDQKEMEDLTSGLFDFNPENLRLKEKNEHLNNLEILLQKETITSLPSTLYLDITNTCNFRCKMCYQSTSHFLQTNIINSHMFLVMQMMPFLSNITVAGLGEPLLSKQLECFASTAQNMRCNTHLITNGSLIPNRIDALKRFSRVSVSFDAARAETFEIIRHRSRFNQLQKNIKLLRQNAPALTICFSVVISRLNLDEIAMITQLAADLNINEINMTPIEHMPLLELTIDDEPLFNQQLAQATHIAQQHNLILNNSVIPESFKGDCATPRDKKKLLAYVNEMPVRKERSNNIDQITAKLSAQKFNYYPKPIVFGHNLSSPLIPKPPITPQPFDKNEKSDFNLAQETERLDDQIKQLTSELQEKPADFFKVPYCLDPWKLIYVKSNGTNRLCCHADTVTGNLGDQGAKESLNSPKYQRIRRSMFKYEEMLPECKKCRAADKHMGIQGLQALCANLKIALT